MVLLALLKKSYCTAPKKDKSQTEALEAVLWRKISNRLAAINRDREEEFKILELDYFEIELRIKKEMVFRLLKIDQEQEKTAQALMELTKKVDTISMTKGLNHSKNTTPFRICYNCGKPNHIAENCPRFREIGM